jgi:hypothetical protein
MQPFTPKRAKAFTERIQLEEGETVLLVARKHWFILLRGIFMPVLLFVVPLCVYIFTGDVLKQNDVIASIAHTDAILLFSISLWGLLIWMMIFLAWTDYYLDMWTITTRRIISIDQRGFFRRTVASFRYERLQDIEVRIDGVIATMLDFGDIHAETAGHEADFKIPGAPNPREIKRLILEAADKALPGQTGSTQQASAREAQGGV